MTNPLSHRLGEVKILGGRGLCKRRKGGATSR